MKYLYRDLTLYNLPELSEMTGLGRMQTPEAVILRGLERFGGAFLARINGDFALAVSDPSNGEILVARDPLGIRPLYYTRSESGVIFGGSIGELLARTEAEKVPDLRSMVSLLKRGSVACGDTLYRGIRRVPPAHLLRIGADGETLTRYWFPERIAIDYSLNLSRASERFVGLLERAVARRIGGEAETAFELSGGLDSSSLYALALKRFSGRRFSAYTLSYGSWACDESGYVRAFEAAIPCDVRRIAVDRLDFSGAYSLESNYRLNPHWPPITTATMYLPLAERLHAEGRRIVLTGQGGDQLLGGSCHLLGDLLRRGRWRALFWELYTFLDGPIRFSFRCFRDAVPSVGKGGAFMPRRAGRERETILPLGGEAGGLLGHRMRMLLSDLEMTVRDGAPFHALEAAYGFRFRHPFYDRELVEYLLTLPPESLYSRGWTKLPLRYGLEGILPDPIRSRRDKAEFSALIRRELEAEAERSGGFPCPELQRLGLLERPRIHEMERAFIQKDDRELLLLWRAVNLESWYRFHFIQKENSVF